MPVGNFANANANKLCSDGATAGTVPLAAGHNVMALWFTNNAVMSAVLYLADTSTTGWLWVDCFD